jgi:endonuclease/exonuclease/phosphatase family metal-dependent hydrolase
MRIATFNILSGRSPGDDRVDEVRFAEAVRALDADVLGLQEVDRNQPRSQHADLTAIAAEAMGAVAHRFVAALHGVPAMWTPSTGEPRVGVVAEVTTPSGPVRVVNTHLSFLRGWNVRQLRVLLRGLGDLSGPMVLLGDLNMRRATAERVTGLRPLATGATFPAQAPSLQIDHLLATPDLQARSGGPVRLPMSDHLALVAEVSLA